MTQEEKEREAERLYVLFDRMANSGVMEVENPIRQAQAQGRFSETTDEAEAELKRLQEEEEEDERQVLEDMERYRARKAAGAEVV